MTLRGLTRPQAALLVLALFLILDAVLFSLIQNDRQTSLRLEGEVAAARRAARETGDPEALRRQIATAQEKLKLSSSRLPEKVDNIGLLTHILQAAKGNVELMAIEMRPPTTERMGGGVYSIFAVQVRASGNAQQVERFLGTVEKGPYNSLMLSDVTMSQSSHLWDVRFQVQVFIQPS